VSFTQATITHKFTNANQTPASGAIEFTLTKRMSQSGQTITPGSVAATLDMSGNLSQALTANNDPGTIPGDAQWRVDFRILGAEQDSYYITVPTGGGTIDLYTLLPQNTIGA
jgi:hypothetical protein